MPMKRKLKGRSQLSGQWEDEISRRVFDHVHTLNRAIKELRGIDREKRTRLAAIAENSDLTSEAKAIESRKVKEAIEAKRRKLQGQAEQAWQAGERLARQMFLARSVDPAVQQRVRRDLERGVVPSQILDRARQLRDGETIAALRAEMLYFGDRDGYADTGETITACERALADVGHGPDRERSRASLELRETAEPLKAVSEFAAKAASGTATAHDRMAFAYATGSGLDGQEDA